MYMYMYSLNALAKNDSETLVTLEHKGYMNSGPRKQLKEMM